MLSTVNSRGRFCDSYIELSQEGWRTHCLFVIVDPGDKGSDDFTITAWLFTICLHWGHAMLMAHFAGFMTK